MIANVEWGEVSRRVAHFLQAEALLAKCLLGEAHPTGLQWMQCLVYGATSGILYIYNCYVCFPSLSSMELLNFPSHPTSSMHQESHFSE